MPRTGLLLLHIIPPAFAFTLTLFDSGTRTYGTSLLEQALPPRVGLSFLLSPVDEAPGSDEYLFEISIEDPSQR